MLKSKITVLGISLILALAFIECNAAPKPDDDEEEAPPALDAGGPPPVPDVEAPPMPDVKAPSGGLMADMATKAKEMAVLAGKMASKGLDQAKQMAEEATKVMAAAGRR